MRRSGANPSLPPVAAPRSIYLRLLPSVAGALVAAVALAWWLGTRLYEDVLFDRLDARLARATELVAAGDLPLTPALLQRFADLLAADLALVDEDGRPVLATAGAPERLPPALRPTLDGRLHDRAAGTYTVARRLARPDSRFAAVLAVADTRDVQSAAREAALWLGLLALGIAAVVGAVAYRAAQRLSRRVDALAGLAEQLAGGARDVRVETTGSDEISALAGHLNDMAARIDAYENEARRRSRSEALGEMAGRVAHEIRNPLTALKLQLQMLAERVPEAAGTAEGLLREVARLELIVAGTLEFGRDNEVRLSAGDLAEPVREVLDLMAPQLRHRRIDVEIDNAGPVPVLLDADRIKQVVLNLVNNAAEAMESGGSLRVAVEARDGAGTLEIEDSGPGLPADIPGDQLFESGTTGRAGGLGFGLAVARDIVEAHGGHLTAGPASTLGGAGFRAALPLHILGADESPEGV